VELYPYQVAGVGLALITLAMLLLLAVDWLRNRL